jgi:hypothetical protein
VAPFGVRLPEGFCDGSGIVVVYDGAVDSAVGLGESTMDISIFDFSEGRSEG